MAKRRDAWDRAGRICATIATYSSGESAPEWMFNPFIEESETERGGDREMTMDEAESEARAAGLCVDQVPTKTVPKEVNHGRTIRRKARPRIR
jgi:hypothetical protein